MTVDRDTGVVQAFAGSGTSSFPVTLFNAFEAGQLRAAKVETATGTRTVLTLGAGVNGFSVTIVAGLPTVLTTEPVAVGWTLYAWRATDALQPSAMPTHGRLPSQSVEQALDRLVELVQERAPVELQRVKLGEADVVAVASVDFIGMDVAPYDFLELEFQSFGAGGALTLATKTALNRYYGRIYNAAGGDAAPFYSSQANWKLTSAGGVFTGRVLIGNGPATTVWSAGLFSAGLSGAQCFLEHGIGSSFPGAVDCSNLHIVPAAGTVSGLVRVWGLPPGA